MATSSALARIVARDFTSQSDFAAACGVDRTAVNRDLTGRSASIPDDRLGAYLRTVSPEARIELLRARLLDIVPGDLHDSLLFSRDSPRVSEPLPAFPSRIPLTGEQRSALEWLADQLTQDNQLIEPIITICERLGWDRPGTKGRKTYK